MRVLVLVIGTLLTSMAVFALSREFILRHDGLSLSTGAYSIVTGLLVSAQGVGWKRKVVHVTVLFASFMLLVLLGTTAGSLDILNAPAQLGTDTIPSFLLFLLFLMVLPWGIPIVSLIVFLGGDVRLLWEPKP